jgi:hypothetical protein
MGSADADGMKLRFVPSVVMSSDSLEGNPPGSPAVPIERARSRRTISRKLSSETKAPASWSSPLRELGDRVLAHQTFRLFLLTTLYITGRRAHLAKSVEENQRLDNADSALVSERDLDVRYRGNSLLRRKRRLLGLRHSASLETVLADHALYYRSTSSPCKVSRGESASRQCRFRLAE